MTITEDAPPVHRRGVVTFNGALASIPLEMLCTGVNRRMTIDPTSVRELARSMARLGQLLPIVVEQVGLEQYRVLEGHRRLKAAPLADMDRLLAVIRRPVEGADRDLTQLAIHAQFRAFEPIAEAHALAFAIFSEGMSREEVADAVGKTPAWVAARLALLNLTPDEQRAVETRQMPLAAAAQLARQRRAARDGREYVPPVRSARRPVARRAELHFVVGHPLAAAAAARCSDHRDRNRIGGVACGECWEHAIRTDTTPVATGGTP